MTANPQHLTIALKHDEAGRHCKPQCHIPDDAARNLVCLIVAQAYADIETYLRLVVRLKGKPVPPYGRYGKYVGEIVRNYETAVAFFSAPVTVDGQPYRSYCECLMFWAGIDQASRRKKIMGIVENCVSLGENLRVAQNRRKGV